jgi:putative salt-induced outer membrane protein YdiY
VIILFLAIAALISSSAKNHIELPLHTQAELGALVITGEQGNEDFNGRIWSEYTFKENVITMRGHFLNRKVESEEQAYNWDVGFRYERKLVPEFGLFYEHSAESDKYFGYVQRDADDIGARYFLVRDVLFDWIVEGGLRYAKTIPTYEGDRFENFGRLAMSWDNQLTRVWSVEVGVEYLPNFTHPDGYWINSNLAISAMLSHSLYLKYRYLYDYQNQPQPGTKYISATSLLNLAAYF